MTAPLLYTYRRCPFAMRARMALLQAHVGFDAQEIQLRDKPAALLALSPKGTVPVMQLPDGSVLEQSLDIMRWAFDGRDGAGWWQRAFSSTNSELVALNDGPFKQHLDHYKYPERHPDADATWHRGQAVLVLLEPLEQQLSQARWLGGATPCAADLAIFPFVRQFRAVDPQWFDGQARSATQHWLQSWLDSPQFAACMQKLPTGMRTPFPMTAV
ncbi:MAG: glutathione S-transferase [Comamonadaceae bacterium]|nr:MAG: glutathione S-transferase [Comamonadaceae bacterium]